MIWRAYSSERTGPGCRVSSAVISAISPFDSVRPDAETDSFRSSRRRFPHFPFPVDIIITIPWHEGTLIDTWGVKHSLMERSCSTRFHFTSHCVSHHTTNNLKVFILLDWIMRETSFILYICLIFTDLIYVKYKFLHIAVTKYIRVHCTFAQSHPFFTCIIYCTSRVQKRTFTVYSMLILIIVLIIFFFNCYLILSFLFSLCTALLPVNFSQSGSIKEHLISS